MRMGVGRYLSGLLIFLLVLLSDQQGQAQSGQNPFELTPRLSPSEQKTEESENSIDSTLVPTNPFELQRPAEQSTGEAAPLTSPSPEEQTNVTAPSESIRSPGSSNREDGPLLLLVIALLFISTLVFIFFRSLYRKTYKAILNDNMLSQLYREREAGALGRFLISYVVFFLSGGLFIYVAGDHLGVLPAGSMLSQIAWITLALTAVFLGKHLLLAIIGYVFPVRKEIQRYSFTIMVFSIVLGLLLVPGCLLVGYAPLNWRTPAIFIILGIIVLAYLLRSIRGLFIANRFVFSYQFHFLLYICAVEIVPALFLYKLLIDNFS